MNSISHKRQWIANIQRRHNDLVTVSKWDPFEDWEKAKWPIISISGELQRGLDVLYSGLDRELGLCFLERSRALIERSEKDGKLDADKEDVGYYLTRAEFMAAKAFTLGIRDGVTRTELLRQAAGDYMTWVRQSGRSPRLWHDQDQAYCLEAITLHLLVGDIVKADESFDYASPTQWHHREARLWRDLCAEWLSDGRLSEALKVLLWHQFDIVRDPAYNPDVFVSLTTHRLEFGAIMWKYVLEHKGDIEWNAVIELISR